MTEQDRADFEAWARSVGADAHKGSEDLEWSPSVRRYTKVLTHNYYLAWLAARRTQDAKVRELVEAIEKYGKAMHARLVAEAADENGIAVVENVLYDNEELAAVAMFDLAAQLKEQDDDLSRQ